MDAYYWWLTSKISKRDIDRYSKLLHLLYSREYYSAMREDLDRVYDALGLRYEFEDEVGYSVDFLGDSCSVLELMIGMAIRCEDVIWNGKGPGYWFWEMVKSMGLQDCTDDRFDMIFASKHIDRMLDRTYDEFGHGGLFTICSNHPMNRLPLWSQMQAYLNEIF